MNSFADRLIGAIRGKGNPCVVGLDPRIDEMPHFVTERILRSTIPREEAVCRCTRSATFRMPNAALARAVVDTRPITSASHVLIAAFSSFVQPVCDGASSAAESRGV